MSASDELRVTDRALAILIEAWRNRALHLERTGKDGEADALRIAASMLEQTVGLCAVCGGRGVERSEPFEDEPGGWFSCFMCEGTGRRRGLRQCAVCGDLAAPPDVEEVSPGRWLDRLCLSVERMAVRYPEVEVPSYVRLTPLGKFL